MEEKGERKGEAEIQDTRMTPWHFDLSLVTRIVVLTAPCGGKGKQTRHMEKNSKHLLQVKQKENISPSKLACSLDCLS